LICIPFAGGSIYSFKDFHSTSDDLIRIIPVELPGRGKRVNEHLLTNIHQIVDDLFIQIEDKLDEPYAIYGHSLGSLLGYLLVKLVLEKKRSPPVHLFCSGRGGPSLSMDDERLVDLPDKVFRDKLRELGGSPDEIFQNEEMIAFFEPILRADFRAHEDYEYIDTKPFDVPITVMVGREDRITLEDVELWQCETSRQARLPRQMGSSEIFVLLVWRNFHSLKWFRGIN